MLKNSEYKFFEFLLMPDDISIQVSGSIGTISGSVGLKFDPFKPVSSPTTPATIFEDPGFGSIARPTPLKPTQSIDF